MRSLQRRKQKIWVCTSTVDDSHSEPKTTYSKPIMYRVTVSNTSGTPHELPVGVVAEYSRYFISFNRNFHPKEGMLLYVDRIPVLDKDGELVLKSNGEPIVKPDYVLSHIMDTSKGTIARYGIRKIAGTEDDDKTIDDEPVGTVDNGNDSTTSEIQG